MTHPEDTAIIERDLCAVDTALSDAGASHPDSAARDLQELALALRDDSPVPDPSFTWKRWSRLNETICEVGTNPVAASGNGRDAESTPGVTA